MEFNLRLAEEHDRAAFIRCVEKGFKEGPYKNKHTYSPERVSSIFTHLLTIGKNAGLILLAEDKETKEVIGLFVAMISLTSAGLEPTATELLWWVAPEARKTRLSITLVNAFEFWAKKVGVTKLILGSMENEHAAAIDKFYTKRGYELTERTYYKELK